MHSRCRVCRRTDSQMENVAATTTTTTVKVVSSTPTMYKTTEKQASANVLNTQQHQQSAVKEHAKIDADKQNADKYSYRERQKIAQSEAIDFQWWCSSSQFPVQQQLSAQLIGWQVSTSKHSQSVSAVCNITSPGRERQSSFWLSVHVVRLHFAIILRFLLTCCQPLVSMLNGVNNLIWAYKSFTAAAAAAATVSKDYPLKRKNTTAAELNLKLYCTGRLSSDGSGSSSRQVSSQLMTKSNICSSLTDCESE